jgi:quinol monooxygenase YgiN
MSVSVIVRFHAAEGKAELLRALLQEGRDFSLRAEGCEAFDVYQNHDAPNKLVMVEHWTSLEAHDANFDKNVKGSGHLSKIVPLLVEPIQSGVYSAV